MITKYYRHPYIYKLKSTDRETHRVDIGTTMNQYEVLVTTGRTRIDRYKTSLSEMSGQRSNVIWSHPGQILNFKKIDPGQL